MVGIRSCMDCVWSNELFNKMGLKTYRAVINPNKVIYK